MSWADTRPAVTDRPTSRTSASRQPEAARICCCIPSLSEGDDAQRSLGRKPCASRSALLEREPELDGRPAVEGDEIDVRPASVQVLGREIEDPLRIAGRPTERRVAVRRFDGRLVNLTSGAIEHLCELEVLHDRRWANRHAVNTAHAELHGHGAASLFREDARSSEIDRLQNLLPWRAVARHVWTGELHGVRDHHVRRSIAGLISRTATRGGELADAWRHAADDRQHG